ncbi:MULTISPECIES: sulfite exporter TauE/SafE family protein [Ectothiorhodospira]|uniref:sulfite exporter TauE/SafE family protein n=1 Tax=Ectothiorhodospira TaxID=1051 RepID=UPI0004BB460D|nr:sulfite exporter TauE/SafE family protein [Ectothiorhodospira haloalkaliphila]MCG5493689.1 sulfite exporter TauE/SafE family protein [Ectothiorhodospira variabilis]MCG5505227.1 sulfite exporter TauE/SafE family protein [Ectothiorhodospira variabilis]MCG5508412.1 sulfite exporter TauE/SafE family protein [Ectothiorhodospira variabilis]MCG5526007.1 sulfite exporter TauE/SafE family protein [Ectothiorhodospira haloalkaliphila]
MFLEPLSILIIATAAFFAGIINALAGGGSFLTLPALVFTGVPPVAANATGTAALLPGYLASAWAYRDLIKAPAGLSVLAVVVIGAVGGAAGALLLLATSDQAFRAIVPWLLLFATVLFAFGPRLHGFLARRAKRGHGLWGRVGVLAVCGYGGYFNGGMGIVMLAMFRLLGVHDLNVANGLKNLLSAVLTVIAVAIYMAGGAISWPELPPMALAAVLGGFAGARIGRRLPPNVLRNGIVLVGAITTVIFFVELFG